MSKPKQVQIDYDLLVDLVKWHLGELHDPDREVRIKSKLWDKMERAAARENYTKHVLGDDKTES